MEIGRKIEDGYLSRSGKCLDRCPILDSTALDLDRCPIILDTAALDLERCPILACIALDCPLQN